jgi:hypothetical protein
MPSVTRKPLSETAKFWETAVVKAEEEQKPVSFDEVIARLKAIEDKIDIILSRYDSKDRK